MKIALSVIAFAVMTGTISMAQPPVHNDIVVTITDYDYTIVNPDIGIVSGTYAYHLSYKLSKEGYLEGIHWNARDFNLWNDKGEKVLVIDSGHDTYGFVWCWFNTPALMNEYNPGIIYSCPDGWMDPFMAPEMPEEGVTVEMSCKIMVKGSKFTIPLLALFHMNAKGVYTVEMIKP